MNPLVSLPNSSLESLLDGFTNGALKFEVTETALLKAGLLPEAATEVSSFLRDNSYSAETVTAMLQVLLQARAQMTNVSLSQSLVVTGPETPHITNLKTGSRFLQIVEHAQSELMLATFALYQGDKLLEPIYQAMVKNPELRVTLILNIQRSYGDRTISEDLIESSRQDFRRKSWPWEPLPQVYYYPESLNMDAKERSSMHAKFLIADEERCFITSANFTEAAQKRNIEIGVELQHSHEPKALSRYFKELIKTGILKRLF